MATPSQQELSGIAYLFGSPIAHSLSPLLHQTVFDELDLQWKQLPFESDDIDQFMELAKDPKFVGASVTMPNKIAIMRYLDALEPAARDVGACNTIFVRDDPGFSARQLIGTNTDIIGIREALYQNVADPNTLVSGKPVAVVGGGGSARSAVYALRKMMHAAQIYIINRDVGEAEALIADCRKNWDCDKMSYVGSVAEGQALENPAVIVSCVPDSEPNTAEEKRAQEVLTSFLDRSYKGWILEMCYHPRPWTRIAEMAHQAGWQVILGTEAMIYQGMEQARFWTGRDIKDLPVHSVKEAVAAELAVVKAKF